MLLPPRCRGIDCAIKALRAISFCGLFQNVFGALFFAAGSSFMGLGTIKSQLLYSCRMSFFR